MLDRNAAPLFSVIVPVYNTERYLRQCMDSILRQTFKDFEVILVDDGSTDGSSVLCDRYMAEDSRIQVVHKENGGLVSARKAGLAHSRGIYIMNVDSDDYIDQALLEKLADAISTHRPEAVLFNMLFFSEEDTTSLENGLEPGLYAGEKMDLFRRNLVQNDQGEQRILYNLCAMACLREKYGAFQNAVPNTIARGEDLAVSAPLLASCDRVLLLDYRGYYYRNNPSSIMNTYRLEEIDQIKQLVRYLSEALGPAYENSLNGYTLTHYFDFLDRGGYGSRRFTGIPPPGGADPGPRAAGTNSPGTMPRRAEDPARFLPDAPRAVYLPVGPAQAQEKKRIAFHLPTFVPVCLWKNKPSLGLAIQARCLWHLDNTLIF